MQIIRAYTVALLKDLQNTRCNQSSRIMILTVCGKLRHRKSMSQSYFDHPSSVELRCSSLARGLKILPGKVREETSTSARNGFSQLCSALPESQL